MFHAVFLHRRDGFLDRHAVHPVGVDHDAVILGVKGFLGHIAALDDLDDRQAELHAELPVALVMAGHAHHGAGSVTHQDVVGDKHRNARVVHRVHHTDALQANAGFLLVQFAALEVTLACGFSLVGLNLIPVGNLILPFFQDRMLRRKHHIGHAVKRIGTCGVNCDLIAVGDFERHFHTGGAADPVLLLNLYTFNIVQVVQVIDESVGILGDAQHPLALFLADHFAAAALADAVDDLFIGKADFAAGAPVDGHGRLVCETVLVHLQEDPLRPLVVVGVGGIHATVPVKAVSQHLQLPGEIGNVFFCNDGRMDMILNRIVLGRQAERIVADRENDVVAVHPLFTGDNVDGGKGARMTHMQARCAGIRELNQPVKLRARIAGDGGIRFLFFPDVLPFLFNGSEIVFHNRLPSLQFVVHSSPARLQSRSPLLRGQEGMRASPPLHHSTGVPDHRTFWLRR